MPVYIKLLSTILAILFFVIFLSFVRNRSIQPFYTGLWLIISLVMLTVVTFEGFYKWIATSLGIIDASFLISTAVIFFLIIYVLHLSIKASEMSDRIQELISFTSILEHRVRKGENPDRLYDIIKRIDDK